MAANLYAAIPGYVALVGMSGNQEAFCPENGTRCYRQLRLYSRVARPGMTGEYRATKCLVHSPCHAGRG